MKRLALWTTSLLLICTLVTAARTAIETSRQPPRSVQTYGPNYCIGIHNVGKVALSITNTGAIGTGHAVGDYLDCFTGEKAPSCEYPKGSAGRYLYGAAFWI